MFILIFKNKVVLLIFRFDYMSVVRSCRSLFMRQVYRWERILIDQMCMGTNILLFNDLETNGPKSRFYTYKFENSYCCIVDPV